MPSFSTYTLAAMALLSSVQAGFYTTYPVGADTVNPGQSIVIKWKPDEQEPILTNVKSYTLKFMTGGNFVQTTVSTIGTFDISKTEIPFTIPNTAPGMYFLMYTAEGSGSSWSTRFSIGGGTTWYPEGVATGMDPGVSSSDNGSSHSSETATHSSTPAEPSSDSSSSEQHTQETDSSSETSKTSGQDNNGSNSQTGSEVDTGKSDTIDSNGQENTNTDTDAANTDTNSDGTDTDGQSEEQNTDNTEDNQEEENSQSEQDSETDEQSSSSEESSSSGAAYQYLSVAALAIASVFMI
ncbi:hypothetical protein LPJ64_002277 [Coemansia asiatica]|uniref:Ser-Thr-rich glycosyl-phosphatidyl-inositol-anchored membrane family-domain-containing protein n=1 Tax=Coemansia asiatica TaxID=1052880 RepID=A0A9W7XND8_9FUNG|nr:hypothetical protein LPJ64_002277 [Coemansia asiatica]